MKRIIVALDGTDETNALSLARKLQGLVWGFKVNDLLIERGTNIVEKLKEFGGVFADPKLYDIPNTVANSVKKLAVAGADLITIHASGGRTMISQAAEAAGSANILAVTVLTSFNEAGCKEVYGNGSQDTVLSLAQMAAEAGAHGLVCSTEELEMLSSNMLTKPLLKVVPGIRPSWYGRPDDQVRVKTPADAVALGADYLVIGRPITEHRDPIEATKMVLRELEVSE